MPRGPHTLSPRGGSRRSDGWGSLRPRRWHLVGAVAAVIVILILQVGRVSSMPVESAATGSDRSFGALYRPEHNWQYPVKGGLPDRGALRAAIKVDLEALSKYVTHIRTLSATHFGIDVVPIAHEYGLKVFLGIPLLALRSEYWRQIEAMKRAVKKHPKTIAAVFLEDPSTRANASVIKATLEEAKYALGSHAPDVTFGITKRLVPQDKLDVAEWFDVIGIDGAWTEETLADPHVRDKIAFVQTGQCFDMNPQATLCTGQQAIDHYNSFLHWRPPSSGIVKMWSAAFDNQVDDRSPGASLAGDQFGLFTVDRERKRMGFPVPLSASEDPFRLPAAPYDPNCPVGAYYLLFQFAWIRDMTTVCAASGFNFRNWAKFDERTVTGACVNWGCHALINDIEAFLNDTTCPSDDRMSRSVIRESIVNPFQERCRDTQVPQDTAKLDYRPNPASCFRDDAPFDTRELVIMADKSTGKGLCESITGYRVEDLEPLTDAMLKKMCFQSSCELIFYQMATPPTDRTGCTPQMIAKRDAIEATILRPYYDGCYEPSSLAADYYDVAYRQRKTKPTMPLPANTTIVPIIDGPDDDDAGSGEMSFSSVTPNHRATNSLLPPSRRGGEPDLGGSANSTQAIKPTTDKLRVVTITAAALVVVSLLASFVVRRIRQRDRRPQNAAPLEPRQSSATNDDSEETNCALVWRTNEVKPVWADSTLVELFIEPTAIRDVRLIGSGGQALVYLVKYTLPATFTSNEPTPAIHSSSTPASGQPPRRRRLLAAKRLGTHHATNEPEVLANFIAEIKLVASLQHPQIVSLVGVTWTNGFDVQALFEYMPGGDLCNYLSATKGTDEARGWTATKLQLAIDVVDALAYVHARTPVVAHRDIKSRNVLLSASPTTTASHQDTICSPVRAKLTDFGVARSQSDQGTMTTGVGTSRWLAPEVIVGGGAYDESCDVYSFGVLLSELDTHELPFMDQRTSTGGFVPAIALMEAIAEGNIKPTFGSTCPPMLLTLARSCLAFDPKERPSAAVVAEELRHYRQHCTGEDLIDVGFLC